MDLAGSRAGMKEPGSGRFYCCEHRVCWRAGCDVTTEALRPAEPTCPCSSSGRTALPAAHGSLPPDKGNKSWAPVHGTSPDMGACHVYCSRRNSRGEITVCWGPPCADTGPGPVTYTVSQSAQRGCAVVPSPGSQTGPGQPAASRPQGPAGRAAGAGFAPRHSRPENSSVPPRLRAERPPQHWLQAPSAHLLHRPRHTLCPSVSRSLLPVLSL